MWVQALRAECAMKIREEVVPGPVSARGRQNSASGGLGPLGRQPYVERRERVSLYQGFDALCASSSDQAMSGRKVQC